MYNTRDESGTARCSLSGILHGIKNFENNLFPSREEQQKPQTHEVAVAGPATMEPRVSASVPQHEQQTTGQSVRTPNVNILHLDEMLKVVVTVVQQIMTLTVLF
jgi:hypothetical protein